MRFVYVKRMTVFLLAGLLSLAGAQGAFAQETYTVSYEVTYGQSEAREMLSLVNELRTGGDAWAWDSENSEKIYYTGLGELTYSDVLEEAAMQRAAELALYYSHARPDGSSCFTALSGYTSAGENIAAGQRSAQAVYTAWEEEDETYAGQGHRRNMLSENFTAIGIGHAVYGNTHFWVQEFAGGINGSLNTDAQDGERTVTVCVDASVVQSASLSGTPQAVSLSVGEEISLPEIEGTIKTSSAVAGAVSVCVQSASWTSSDVSVATVDNGVVSGAGAGSAQLGAEVFGQSLYADVEVTGSANAGGADTAVSESTGSEESETSLGSYTLVLDANGGECDEESVETDLYGEVITLPDALRDGYSFDGWYTEDGEEVTLGDVLTEDETLYAQWTLEEYGEDEEDTWMQSGRFPGVWLKGFGTSQGTLKGDGLLKGPEGAQRGRR